MNDALLGNVLDMVRECTCREAFLLIIALTVRHCLTYKAMLDIFRVLNILFGTKYFPTSKAGIWNTLNLKSSTFKRHAYCNVCHRSLGRSDDLREGEGGGVVEEEDGGVLCPCGKRFRSRRKLKYFITLDLKRQLERFLHRPGVFRLTQYRLTRRKINALALEDIFDGAEFRKLQQQAHLSPHDFTYLFSTDGFKLTRSSDLSAWPVYVKLNEVPPHLRQTTVFLAVL